MELEISAQLHALATLSPKGIKRVINQTDSASSQNSHRVKQKYTTPVTHETLVMSSTSTLLQFQCHHNQNGPSDSQVIGAINYHPKCLTG
jgi:hypothetical protein